MRAFLLYITIIVWTLVLYPSFADAQANLDRIVQINGVTMTADSLRAIPDVEVLVKGKNRGVTTNENGVFTIVVYKGDTLNFSCKGFQPKEFVVPENISGKYFSLFQLMVQDTFYLPVTVFKPIPTQEEFDYAFKNWYIPNDQYERARINTDKLMLRAIAMTLPKDGRESQAVYQQQQSLDAVYYNQIKPTQLGNPLAWKEFFDAWKRGDFRKKK